MDYIKKGIEMLIDYAKDNPVSAGIAVGAAALAFLFFIAIIVTAVKRSKAKRRLAAEKAAPVVVQAAQTVQESKKTEEPVIQPAYAPEEELETPALSEAEPEPSATENAQTETENSPEATVAEETPENPIEAKEEETENEPVREEIAVAQAVAEETPAEEPAKAEEEPEAEATEAETATTEASEPAVAEEKTETDETTEKPEKPAPVKKTAAKSTAKKPATKSAAKPSVAKSPTKATATESVAAKPSTKATSKESVAAAKPSTRYAGKWAICRLLTEGAEESEEMYFFELRASNGEKLLSSEEYTSLSGAIKGIETHKANILKDNFRITLSKKGEYIFKLLSGKNMLLCTGENYKTKTRCEKAIESTKRFAETAIVDENVQDIVVKIPADEDLSTPTVAEGYNGKWIISSNTSADGETTVYYFELFANNGEKLLSSEEYTSYAGAANGIETHKKNIEKGNFRISLTKRGDYIYKLLNGNGQLLCLGEHYKTRRLCQNAVESVKRFALSSPVLTDASVEK